MVMPGGHGWKVGPKRKILHYHGRPRFRTTEGKNRFYTPKPPRGAPGSDEAVLYAGNILYDPGFELFVQNAAPTFLKPGWSAHTGTNVYALPRFDINAERGQVWANGDEVSHFDIAQWSQYTEPYGFQAITPGYDERQSSAWFVIRREVPASQGTHGGASDTTDIIGPNLGVFLARWYGWDCSADYPFGNGVPGGLLIQGPGMPAGYSGRTEPGALITWSFHCWILGPYTDPVLDLCLTFYTQDGSPVHTVVTSNALNNTKTEYSLSSNTPGGSYFMRACATFRGTASSAAMVNVDSGLLGVE